MMSLILFRDRVFHFGALATIRRSMLASIVIGDQPGTVQRDPHDVKLHLTGGEEHRELW